MTVAAARRRTLPDCIEHLLSWVASTLGRVLRLHIGAPPRQLPPSMGLALVRCKGSTGAGRLPYATMATCG
jgi:hypothetical protein